MDTLGQLELSFHLVRKVIFKAALVPEQSKKPKSIKLTMEKTIKREGGLGLISPGDLRRVSRIQFVICKDKV